MKLTDYIISFDEKTIDAIEKMQIFRTRDLLVQKNNKIIGTISEGDILRSLLKNKDLRNKIEDYANLNFKFIKIGDEKKASEIFIKERIFIVPVFDKKFNLVNIITLKNFLDGFKK